MILNKESNDHFLRDHAIKAHASLYRKGIRAAQLQSELDALREDIISTSSAEREAMKSLAQAECAQLCKRIMSRLPRELRDIIFQYLSWRPTESISREYFRSTLDPETKMHTYDTARWRATHYPEHFWDSEYVGNEFYTEMIENYLRSSSFIFGTEDGLIERFLETDQFTIGLAPRELVSKIEIHLNAMTFDRSSCIGYFFGCATTPERLQAALDGMLGLKAGASVCLHFTTQAKDEEHTAEQIRDGCGALIPRLKQAKAAGLVVRMIIDRKVDVNLDEACAGGQYIHT
ncbi:hypothetical protein DE146DRAFT_760746 [Phaeosphaeria sp. MPI-PUGE-AT-0046c]|nr:hypothetical protein DE146DRAFT_760746 [Phaeosphaeria sp. MPI-PUGE-AT-0046c]